MFLYGNELFEMKESCENNMNNNFNGDIGIEISEGWMPTIKQNNSRSVPQRYSDDRNAPVTNSYSAAYNEIQPVDIIA